MGRGRVRPGWPGELVVVLCLLVVYDQVAGLARLRYAEAVAHSRSLLSLEHGGFERALDLRLAAVHWLQAPAAYYYDVAHICVTIGVLALAYVVRPGVYRRARTALVGINLVGLAIFLLYPVAPPRLLPGGGFVDIVAGSHTWFAWDTAAAAAKHANELGSMPSLHAAWACWVALTVTAVTARRAPRVLAWLHVLVTVVVVLATGNHYAVDVVAGALVAALTWAVTAARCRAPVPSRAAPGRQRQSVA